MYNSGFGHRGLPVEGTGMWRRLSPTLALAILIPGHVRDDCPNFIPCV